MKLHVNNLVDTKKGDKTLNAFYHLFLALLLSLITFVAFAAPLAGTNIDNQARASYFDTTNGFNSTIFSNFVRVVVDPLEALTLTASQTLLRAAGGAVSLPHSLTNTGNTVSTYTLNFANLGADNYDVGGLTLTVDLNSNGQADPGEPTLISGATVSLAPGAAINLVLSGTIPTAVSVGNNARVLLSATTTLQGLVASNTDTIQIANSAQFQLSKTASNLTPLPGNTVNFALTASNTGNSPATGVPVVVNGVNQSLFLLRDVIPANTTFFSLVNVVGSTSLYHIAGNPTNSYISGPPADLRTVDAVAFGFASPINPGQSFTRNFSVQVNANASGPMQNTAQLLFNDGINPATTTVNSNSVQMNVPFLPPTIKYYSDNSYTSQITVATTGQSIFVQINAAQCNANPLVIETKQIIISSALTGDVETFIATETGINTGLFRILPSVPTTANAPLVDGIMSVKKNDRLTASLLGCGATQIDVVLLIDPFGVVFDSKTNATVEGATVTLIDITGAGNGGNPGGSARVFQADGVTPAPSTLVTLADGTYQFPAVNPSQYRLIITPPSGFAFPSTLAPGLLPPGRVIDLSGSYGGPFSVVLVTGSVNIDIPLDSNELTGLFIEKSVARKTVEIGEFLDYTIKIKNTSGQLLGLIKISDDLPAGFSYQPRTRRINGGTLRLDGSQLPEPEGGAGPHLVFNIGSIADQTDITLTYRVRVGVGALQGNGINSAQATSAAPLVKVSNIATAVVQVLPGVFSDRGYLIGKVYADCNQNQVQDKGELGVPGVRLFLEDGTSVVTDGLGKYSLYGLRPITHVIKLDNTTLPAGAHLEVLSNRNANVAGSRFVDMKNSELHKADFAIDSCSAELLQEIKHRASEQNGSEQDNVLKTQLNANATPLDIGDVKALPASGTLGTNATTSAATNTGLNTATAASSNIARQPAYVPETTPEVTKIAKPLPANTSLDLDKVLPELDNILAILSPQDKDVLPTAQTNITVKGVLGDKFVLKINGEEVTEKRVGKRSTLEDKKSEAWEYVGINLKPGNNQIEVSQFDAFNNVRGTSSISVVAPGNAAKLKLVAPTQSTPADGKSIIKLKLEVSDDKGAPVMVRTPVTIEASNGVWKNEDLNSLEPGLQLFIENGSTELLLQSPRDPGDVQVLASSGNIKTSAKLSFVPELRPMIVAGIIEGAINLRKLNTKSLLATRAQDGFEQELKNFSRSSSDGKATGSARAAMFLKGKVKGEYLLTLGYDSDKEKKERLFRDIQPDEFYPIYGDSSQKSFDAQSTSRLYVRVDHGKSYTLYGDYTTQQQADDARKLGQYNRSLNGIKSHYEEGNVRGNVFASRDSSRQVVEEIPARGVSGPYVLKISQIKENSEKVEILLRDRDQPSVILSTTPQSRFSDYEIETLTGRILFKAPIPSIDANLNPISIRITYEVDQGGQEFWVAGVDGQVKLNETVEVGGAYVKDNNPQDSQDLASANVTLKLNQETKVIAEVAQLNKDSTGKGNAERIELKHDSKNLQANVFAGKTDVGFDNPASVLNKGRSEAGAKASYKLTEKDTVRGEYLRSEDVSTSGNREGVQIAAEHVFDNNIRGEIGLRSVNESRASADASTTGLTPLQTTSARIKLTAPVPNVNQATVYGEYEQDVSDSDKRVAAIGGEYDLKNGGHLYARHEFISSLGNRYALNNTQQNNTTVVGMDMDYMKDGHVFSEYRINNAFAERDAQAALGLRHLWSLNDNIKLQGGFERTHSFSGNSNSTESMAITGAIEYTNNPLWKGSARLEYRNSQTSDTIFSSLGAAYKLNEEWTFLGKNAFELTKNKNAPDTLRDRVQLGLAYRDATTNLWNGLLRFEQRYEYADAPLAGFVSDRSVSIISGHVNYQPNNKLIYSGHYAGKWVNDQSNDFSSRNNLHLLSGRFTYDLSKKWDVSGNASALFSGDMRSRQGGLGFELGYLLKDNLWLSGGYNIFGFSDKDLVGEGYTNPGIFARIRFKFDENSF